LVRYAQPQPERASTIVELVRRIEWALHAHAKLLEREGQQLWAALETGDAPTGDAATFVVALLRAITELDRLGDALAAWAVDRAGERPDADVDTITGEVARQLEVLGVPREEQRPRTARRPG
jgi:hypothetical protein